ncbi:Pyridoxal phosphate-dependent transferase [Pseudocohnilembus persalinus]|uniref:Pyridoxal phosphate-dependent transferase n=1 Tax=Pseudocohnilembus persalinus TaxID=266149 RepID=A0A0V0R7Q2_PSEPJ|nr:Pyridoxal phosphate-dependent transferase [Pseudocohnilembus persalinus]|eukprot:KRX10513.1 Pyridoxal phosphate-dependent transferase [Pseudocohnilembus persalinus]
MQNKQILKTIQKSAHFQKNFSTVKELVGKNPVRGFALEFAELQKKNPRCINLALGVPMDPTPHQIIDAKIDYVKFSGETGNNGYGDPRGIESLRVNLSKHIQEQYKVSPKHLNENNINIVPGGTSNAISLTVEKLVRNDMGKGEIIVLAPFFGPYNGMIKLSNGVPVIIDTDEQLQPDLKKIEEAITPNTRGILINSPNNPSGKIYPKETIRKIVEIAAKHNCAVISDEIYEKFSYIESKPHTTICSFYEDFPQVNLIQVNSASKTYGMIGDRIGYIISNQLDFIEDITITLGYRFASSPYLPQYAFDAVFSNWDEISQRIEATRILYKQKAEFLVKGLREIGFNAQDLEGGMFAMTEVKSLTGMDGHQLSRYFIEQDAPVAVYPGGFFGESFGNYLRFTTCPTMVTLERGLDQIDKYVKQIKK